MRVEKRDGSVVRKILIGMLVDPAVLGHVAAVWSADLFASKWANLISQWAVRYYTKYEKPPGRAIEGIFESWASKTDDEDTTKLIERFLAVLSDEYVSAKEISSDYVIDMASDYFNKCRLVKLSESISGDIDSGNLEEARKRVDQYNHVEVGQGFGTDVLFDKASIREAFKNRAEPIVKYPGALRNFFGHELCRGGFISFMGPEKRGKTWWLMDLAWRAMLQKRRVAFFEVGDMTKSQCLLRWMIRASRRPLREGSFNYPHEMDHTPGELTATVETTKYEYSDSLTWKVAWANCQNIIKHKIRSDDSYLRLMCTPNDTMTTDGIGSTLQAWERRDWVPDLCIIDYADILAAKTGIKEEREQINSIWKGMRRISQSGSQPLVATATQAAASSYDIHTMSSKHFSNDKRKFAHVTGMIGINQTPEEKELGLQRLNWIQLRESGFTSAKCVHVAGCLAIANPAVLSVF